MVLLTGARTEAGIYHSLQTDSQPDGSSLQLQQKVRRMEGKMFTILLVVLILMLLGALPTWPYSRSWGYYPSGGLGIVVVVLIVLLLMR
jgi:hypothetical protein